MDALGGLWHLFNFIAPAVGIGLVASLVAKGIWFGELKDVAWWRLCAWASTCAVVADVVGLVAFGRDGKMATYAAMVVACALSLWWAGFGPGRR